MSLFAIAVIVFATARTTRFITADDLWKELRVAIVQRLQHPAIAAHRDRNPQTDEVEFKSRREMYLHMKAAELLTCPWCVSVYLSAAILIVSRQAEIHFGWGVDSIPLPVWTWLALSMAATLLIEFTDGLKQVMIVSKHG
jgi:hypothetical protein